MKITEIGDSRFSRETIMYREITIYYIDPSLGIRASRGFEFEERSNSILAHVSTFIDNSTLELQEILEALVKRLEIDDAPKEEALIVSLSKGIIHELKQRTIMSGERNTRRNKLIRNLRTELERLK